MKGVEDEHRHRYQKDIVHTTSSFYEMLGKKNVKFAGVDGNFYFLKNKIERELQILKINDGKATVISKQK